MMPTSTSKKHNCAAAHIEACPHIEEQRTGLIMKPRGRAIIVTHGTMAAHLYLTSLLGKMILLYRKYPAHVRHALSSLSCTTCLCAFLSSEIHKLTR